MPNLKPSQGSSSKPKKHPFTRGAKLALPTNIATFQALMKNQQLPDGFDPHSASASQWDNKQLFLYAIREQRGDLPNLGSHGVQTRKDIANHPTLVGHLKRCTTHSTIFVPNSKFITTCGPFAGFYMMQKEIILRKAEDQESKKGPLPRINPSAEALIMTGKRATKEPIRSEGILTGEDLQRLNLNHDDEESDADKEADPEEQSGGRGHKRNESSDSYASVISLDRDELEQLVIDEAVCSTHHHLLALIAPAMLEEISPPADGYCVRHTLDPVTYKATLTALSKIAYRAKSDGAAWSQIGSSAFRTPMAEPLWLREVKASANNNPLAQQFAQMLAFMAFRVARLQGLGRDLKNINGLPEHVRTVYMVCVNQTAWQMKYIVFPPAYLSAVLGEVPIAGGKSLMTHDAHIIASRPHSLCSANDRISIVQTEFGLAKKRMEELGWLMQLKPLGG